MLMTTKNLPMNNRGVPWGTVILAVVIIGGVGYLGYQVMKPQKQITQTKTKENERG